MDPYDRRDHSIDAHPQRWKPSLVLKVLVKLSLNTFEHDAHQKLLDHLRSCGCEESQAGTFRRAWSKVVVWAEAFRAKISNAAPFASPDIFSEEIMRELAVVHPDVKWFLTMNARFDYHSSSIPPSESEVLFLDEAACVSSLLVAILRCLHKPAVHRWHIDMTSAKTQFDQRESLSGLVVSWSRDHSPSFRPCPMHRVSCGLRRTSAVGVLKLGGHSSIPSCLSTHRDICGITFSADATHTQQDRAWWTYSCMAAAATVPSWGIFPIPIDTDTSSISSCTSGTFIFQDHPGSIALTELKGPTLGVLLAKFPLIPLAWCFQIACTLDSLFASDGRLAQLDSVISNLSVRSDGLLILNNVAFDFTQPSQEYCEDVISLFWQLLATVMCTSRDELLSRAQAVRSDGEDEEVRTVGAATRQFGIGVGGCLRLLLPCVSAVFFAQKDISSRGLCHTSLDYRVAAESVVGARLGEETVLSSTSTVRPALHRIVVRSDERIADISMGPAFPQRSDAACRDSDSSGTLGLRGESGHGGESGTSLLVIPHKPGVLSVQIMESGDGISIGEAERVIAECAIVVLPSHPVDSVQLQDMLGHLELAYYMGDSSLMLDSSCFLPGGVAVQAQFSQEKIAHQWKLLLRSMGHNHNKD